ncbi:MAG: Asp-tRNA(Asn)/Glu-tRNA(Gln) amidotransferase subunit GatA [Patescibacteria group bacterium]
MDVRKLTINELRFGYLKHQFSVREVVSDYLKKINEQDKDLGAYLYVAKEEALTTADNLDKKIARGASIGLLAGVPVAVKDVLVTEGMATTAGSRILENYKPPYNATAVQRILNEDAIILGKTNCDEFAMGASGENSGFKPAHNPWNKKCVPGGSSSGSAAAVAAGLCRISLGSDTAGSIRQPASFCGLVGVKPTYGRVSRYGLIAMASSFDTIGPLTATVEEAAQVLQIIAGYDHHDATSQNKNVPNYLGLLKQASKKLRIGVVKEFFAQGLDTKVGSAVMQALAVMQKFGHELVEVNLPTIPLGVATYYIITPAEVSANLARYDGLRYGHGVESNNLFEFYTKTRALLLGPEVKRRIILGTYILSAGYYDAYYRQAVLAREAIKADFNKVFAEVDVVAGPTTPTTAFALGEKTNDPLAMYLADANTAPVNIAGLPAVSVPCGLIDGLPVGLQLIGPAWSEGLLMQLVQVYETERGPFLTSLPNKSV